MCGAGCDSGGRCYESIRQFICLKAQTEHIMFDLSACGDAAWLEGTDKIWWEPWYIGTRVVIRDQPPYVRVVVY